MTRNLISETDLATRPNLSVKTLRGWRRRGEGPPFLRLGRRSVRYELTAVDKWLARSLRSPADDPSVCPGPDASE
jgi:predicted DNA-binding transcriptional regulator AlpA